MKVVRVLIVGAVFLAGCSFGSSSATESGEGTEVVPLVPTSSLTPSPTNKLPPPTNTPNITSTPSYTEIDGQQINMAAECRQSVTALSEYQSSFELPEELSGGEVVKLPIEGGINLGQYFTILDAIRMEEGYSLSYVYFSDFLGGKPLVYAYPSIQNAYRSYEEFIEAMGGTSEGQQSFDYLEYAYAYLLHIQAEDRPEGYFQFAALSLIGDEFYLFWHGLYHDEIIICGAHNVDLIRAELEDFQLSVPQEVLQGAAQLDLEPYVILGDEAVLVRFVYFTKWGGFVEALVTIARDFPHDLLNIEINVLVEYDCGIMF